MNLSRRALLRYAGVAASASSMGWMQALAAPATDYKALVCLFMFGGNDGNNLIVPMNTDEYTAYSTIRGGLALPSASLLPLGTPPSMPGRTFGLHPAFSALQPLWQQGKLAVQCNVGSLVAPATVADYKANKNRPYSLFSHSDQQTQWQTADSNEVGRTGWGGRIIDTTLNINAGTIVPGFISVAGSTLLGVGDNTAPLVVPSTGTFGLSGAGTSAAAKARTDGIAAILGLDKQNTLAAAASGVLGSALGSASLINPIINNATSAVAAPFTGLKSGIANQLLAVAKMIEARGTTGLSRQVFFVSLGGFDTHSKQLTTQDGLFKQVGDSLAAFYSALNILGLTNNVTTFTASDFARTLRPNSDGTDHAWGNHHLVLGGGVKGGDFYGSFPTLALNGPNDVDGAGRWLPTTSIDQYAATFASWFGVSPSDLSTVLPHLSRFDKKNMGFV